jgi:acyl transferase domain-containing protein/alpha-beta hydrolase superfamily lysophospholipase
MSTPTETQDYRALLTKSLRELEAMQEQLRELRRTRTEPIAIIGIGCRFPGHANDPEAFWDLLRRGQDGVIEVPPERWDLEALYDPDPAAPGKMYTRKAGFIDNIDRFDPLFFNLTPREAERMDPQQRLLLELAWQALEHAGVAPGALQHSKTGVFIGLSSDDYLHIGLEAERHKGDDIYLLLGNLRSIAAGRLSFQLGLQGPSMQVDTSCSSSLVAIHLACTALRNRECDLALAGGVQLLLLPSATIVLCKMRALAPDGYSKGFAATADGFGRGEGGGILVLKRLSEALAAHDQILALIRGSAVNHDGLSSGLTVPNEAAQEAVIRQALANAHVPPAAIDYVEAHGTGTHLGDPIEVSALGAVFAEDRSADRPLLLGSVKSNIGHLEAAAGVAGVIKTTLALWHRAIPAHLHFHTPNPHIPWEQLPLRVPTCLQPWPAADGKRRLAGVSSFGMSGTNVHLVLEEAPPTAPVVRPCERPWHLLVLSAKTDAALRHLAGRYRDHLAARPALPFADVCFTAAAGRSHFQHRLALVGAACEPVRQGLDAWLADRKEGMAHAGQTSAVPQIAFVFTGQGSQYANMGQELYTTHPRFRDTLDRLDAYMRPYLPQPLLQVLFPQDGTASPIDDTGYTQPALFALQYALADLWRSWGITPVGVMGHSVGEYAAACMAGVFSLEHGARLICERAQLMHHLPRVGGMLAVFAPQDLVLDALAPFRDRLAVAAYNGPQHVVVSGETPALATLAEALQRRSIQTQALRVSHAFHSSAIDPILPSFHRIVQEVPLQRPRLCLVANLTGKPADAQVTDAAYWVQHLRQPVQFARGMSTLWERGVRVFLEIGPHPTLLAMGQACLPEDDRQEVRLLPSLRRAHADWETMLQSLGALYVAGASIDWDAFDSVYTRRRVTLPGYPFQRQRYWLTPAARPVDRGISDQGHTGPGASDLLTYLYEGAWEPLDEDVSSWDASGTWLILADAGGTGQGLARALETRGAHCWLVHHGDTCATDPARLIVRPHEPADFVRLLEAVAAHAGSPELRGIVHLWGCDLPSTDTWESEAVERALSLTCGSALHMLQALSARRARSTARLWLVTRGTQAVDAVPVPPAIAPGPLWGLGLTLAVEQPEHWGGLCDLAPQAPEVHIELLAATLCAARGEDRLALRGSRRYAYRLRRWDRPLPSAVPLHPYATYLITGAFGALGLAVAERLVARGAHYLALLGHHAPDGAQIEAVRRLETAGARVQVFVVDVAEASAMGQVFATIHATLPPLRGVIHAAGTLNDGLLDQQSLERFAQVAAPKIAGAWLLHHLTRAVSLDFFVLFSSAAAVLGSPGQANYAAANAFLDALARCRTAQGLPATSIQWGPWARIGMAARVRVTHPSSRRYPVGFEAVEPEVALAICDHFLGPPGVASAEVAVLDVHWPALLGSLPDTPPLLHHLSPGAETSEKVRPHRPGLSVARTALFQQPPEARQAWLHDYLRQTVGSVVGMAAEALPDCPLADLALDSLMVMEILNRIKKDLGIVVYPREFYGQPGLRDVAAYLARDLTCVQDSAASTSPGPATALQSSAAASSPTWVAADTARSAPHAAGAALPPIVFLLSAPRSGSTLLRVMLAGHPALFAPPELHLLPFETMSQRQHALASTYLGEGLQRALMELLGIDAAAAGSLLEEMTTGGTTIQQVYARLIALAAPRVLVDKSPSYAMAFRNLERAEHLFAGAKYIHLTRHPYAVIESFVTARMHKLLTAEEVDPYRFAEQVWVEANRHILDFAARLEPARYHRIAFESLVTHPRAETERLCAFLGYPFDEALLYPYEGHRMTDGVHASSAPIGDPNFLSHHDIDTAAGSVWQHIRLPRQLGAQTQELADRLGYALPAEPHTAPGASGRDPAMTEQFITVRGLRLCLCSWGPQQGHPILALHGMLDHGAAWEEVARPLAQRSYAFLAPDLRGHGHSAHVGPGGSYHFTDFLADIDGLVNACCEQAVTLVGHSMGALLALFYACTRPTKVCSLILVEVALPPQDRGPDDGAALRAHLDYLTAPPVHSVLPSLDSAAHRLAVASPSLDAARAQRFARRLTEPCEGGWRWRWDPLLQARSGLALDLGKHAIEALLTQLSMPVTLVHGTRGHLLTGGVRELDRLAALARQSIVLQGGHNLHWETPTELAEIIAQAAMVLPGPTGGDRTIPGST